MPDAFVLNDLSAFDHKDIEQFYADISHELSSMRGGNQLIGFFDIQRLFHATNDSVVEPVLTKVASVDGKIVGVLWSSIIENNFGEMICQIHLIAVGKESRSLGIGRALYEQCEKWAKTFGVRGIEMVVLPGDRHSKNFCEGNGLVARSLTMYKPIS